MKALESIRRDRTAHADSRTGQHADSIEGILDGLDPARGGPGNFAQPHLCGALRLAAEWKSAT
jgi:hypothetical protein